MSYSRFKRRLVDFLSIEHEFSVFNGKKVDQTAFKPAVGQSGYELKVREIFESIFRVIMIFFLSVVDSSTCKTGLEDEEHFLMN